MYFGGINGFNVFNPNNIDASEFKPKVILDGIEVNGVDKDEILDKVTEIEEKLNGLISVDTKYLLLHFYFNWTGILAEWEWNGSGLLYDN